MLGQHPDLYGLPELKLFAYLTLGDLEASLPSYAKRKGVVHRSPGLIRAIAQLRFGAQTRETAGAARTWLADRSAWSGAEAFDVIQGWVAPRNAVQKSPDDVQSWVTLHRMSDAYPRARYVHLTRHPTPSVRSMYDHWTRSVPGASTPGLTQVCIDTYVQTHRRILAFGRSVGPTRFLRVRAEDVLNQPDDWLGAIVRWLSLDDGPDAIDAMKHPERSLFSWPGTVGSGISGGGDPAFLSDPVPHHVTVPTGLAPPTGWFDGDEWAQVREMGIDLGY
jgi:hypothetical protein